MKGRRNTLAFAIGLCLWSLPALLESMQLHQAALRGDVASIESFLAAGADVNAKTSKGRTPLHWAAAKGQVEAIHALVKAGAAIEGGDEEGATPLIVAARQGHVTAVEALVNLSAAVNATSSGGVTPLHDAAVWGHAEVVKVLLRSSADISTKDEDNRTALHFAVTNDKVAANRQVATARVLLASPGIEVNARNAKGLTALHLAAFGGGADIIKTLLKASASPDAREHKNASTPLHLAALVGNVEAIEALVAAGADVHAKDRRGRTPRNYAENAGRAAAVTALANALKLQAKPTATGRILGEVFPSQRRVARDGEPARFPREAADGQGESNDTSRANRLMIEAINAMNASKREPSAEGKHNLLRQAFDKLEEIVERYPSTDLAVKLATGQRVGNVSLVEVGRAMEASRLVESRTPGAPVRVWRHTSALLAVALTANDRRAITVNRDGNAVVRDVHTSEVLTRWRHRDRVVTAVLSSNRRRILTAGRDRSVMVHDTRTGRLVTDWTERQIVTGDVPFTAALSAHGRYALTGDLPTRLIDIDALETLRTWRDKRPVGAVAFSPNGRHVIVVLVDGTVLLRDVRTGRTLRKWKSPGSGGSRGSRSGQAAVFSPDGTRAVVVMRETAVLRDVRTGKALHAWRPGGNYPISSVAYSPDARWVLTGDEGYEAVLHDATTGKTRRRWRYNDMVEAVAFSADSRRVLMGFRDGVAILCDLVVPGKSKRSYKRTYLTQHDGCW